MFDLPYAKGIGSAQFHSVEHTDGTTWSGSGVIDFAPQHAFSETTQSSTGYSDSEMDIGGVAYEEQDGAKYQATGFEGHDFLSMGWDGSPGPGQLQLAAQTELDGQQAWVVTDPYSPDKWLIAESTGDPLEAVVAGTTYTFSNWGQAAPIQVPAASEVSTALYSGSASAPVAAPAATVAVLKEQPDPADGVDDPLGFRTVALEISYINWASASSFDNDPTLVSSDGVFAGPTGSMLSPPLQWDTAVAQGQTIAGWDAFLVPQQATSFHLLFGEQVDQAGSLDYLISIAVQIGS